MLNPLNHIAAKGTKGKHYQVTSRIYSILSYIARLCKPNYIYRLYTVMALPERYTRLQRVSDWLSRIIYPKSYGRKIF